MELKPKRGAPKPKKKITLLISTAVVPATDWDGRAGPQSVLELRNKQYIRGIASLWQYLEAHNDLEVFWADNTLASATMPSKELDELARMIPRTNRVFFDDNSLGKENKGAGVIIQWRRFFERLDDSVEQVIHFEPRMQVLSYGFFDRALQNPTTNFLKINRLWRRRARVWPWPAFHMETGLFSMHRQTLAKFAFSQDLEEMVVNSVSIEYSLLDFLKINREEFVDVRSLNVIRHAPEGPYRL